jgi:hypothetical protein
VIGTTGYLAGIPSPARGVWFVGPVPIRAYALFIGIGIVAAVVWGNRRFQARGGRRGRVTDIAMFCVPFGLVGGRLYHVITDNQLYFGAGKNPWQAFAIWNGGLGIWGAIALGGVGAWIGCRHYHIPLGPFADAVAPGIAVAQAIGRLGNYFNQELFGSPTTVPWALEVYLRTPTGGAASLPAGLCEFPTEYIKASPEIICGTSDVPVRNLVEPWNCRSRAMGRPPIPPRWRPGLRRLRRRIHCGAHLDRNAPHRSGEPVPGATDQRLHRFLASMTFLIVKRTPREDPVLVRRPAASTKKPAGPLER